MAETVANRLTVTPGTVQGTTIRVPGDKSITHRALMLAAIAEGVSEIHGSLDSDDCNATRAALAAMGVHIENRDDAVIVHGVGKYGLAAPDHSLDCGNSGTTMRLLAGLLAAQPFETELVGDESLMKRPMERVAEPLRRMAARIETTDGCAPIRIFPAAGLKGIDYHTPVPSAQLKSAILFAGLYADGETAILEDELSRDHTERMLAGFGVECTAAVRLTGGGTLYGHQIRVPGDFSSAAFFVVAALIAGSQPVTISDVGLNETRVGLLGMLKRMGAHITIRDHDTSDVEPVGDITVTPGDLHGIDVDAQDVAGAIDEIPVFCVAAACARGTTRLTGAGELRVKESDRLQAISRLLTELAVEHKLFDDGLEIIGRDSFSGTAFDANGDHRMAMAACVAALRCAAAMTISGAHTIGTSFPGFVDLARSAGMLIESSPETQHTKMSSDSVIAIDGPSGSGKGTISRLVARELGFHLLDSGALYRLTALAASRAGADLTDTGQLADIAAHLEIRFDSNSDGEEQVFLDGEEVSAAIRNEECGATASRVAAYPPVRTALLQLQRGFSRPPGLVADGRDMGSVVFPGAGLKIFLTASADERAQRRYKQLKDKGIDVNLAALSRDIAERDRRDAEREVAPLRPCEDAVIIDTTGVTINEVVQQVLALVRSQI